VESDTVIAFGLPASWQAHYAVNSGLRSKAIVALVWGFNQASSGFPGFVGLAVDLLL
jgi:hypothetical protein